MRQEAGPRRLIKFLVTLFALLVATGLHAQSGTLCGVHLRRSVLAIKSRIEAHDHHPVVCTITTLRSAGMDQHLDGVARIELDPQRGLNEVTATHELLHLELDIEGWPQMGSGSVPETQAEIAHHLVAEDMWSAIQHEVIFGRMERLGISPNKNFLAEVRLHTDRGELPGNAFHFPQLVVISFLRVYEADPSMARRVEELFKAQGLSKISETTKAVHNHIRAASPIKRSESIRLANECESIIWAAFPTVDVSLADLQQANKAGHE
jgi:hypothetical protein